MSSVWLLEQARASVYEAAVFYSDIPDRDPYRNLMFDQAIPPSDFEPGPPSDELRYEKRKNTSFSAILYLRWVLVILNINVWCSMTDIHMTTSTRLLDAEPNRVYVLLYSVAAL